MQKVVDNPAVRDKFYEELSSTVTAPSCFQVFVCGDFKSKLGQRTPEGEEAGLSCCLDAHGKGIHNSNAEALFQFSPTPWSVCKQHSVRTPLPPTRHHGPDG